MMKTVSNKTQNCDFLIKRNFKTSIIEKRIGQDGEIDSNSYDAASVRDLYPYRITEIADFGKIYAAACCSIKCLYYY